MLGQNKLLRPSPMQALAGFLLLVVAIRIILAISVPLLHDEAYYQLWAEQLEWGYYDHPPMIAWWIWLGQTILGDNALGTRLLPVLASMAGSLGVYLLARQFDVDKITARRAAIWIQAVWMIFLAGMIAIPDAPTSFFWLFTCLCVAKAARLDSTRWWLAAGAMAGLACMSKYTALFLAPGILLWLVTSPRYSSQLLRPGPWLAILSALAVFAPNIVWNAQNDWASFSLQFGRAAPETLSLTRPLIFFLLQLIYLGPALFVLVPGGLRQAISARHEHTAIAQCMYFAACTSLPLIVYMLTHGFHSWVGAHWLSPIYPELALLAALGSANQGKTTRQTNIIIPSSAIIGLVAFGPFMTWLMFGVFDNNNIWYNITLILFASLILAHIASSMIPMRKTIKPVIMAMFALAILAETTFLISRYQNPNPQIKNWAQLAEQLRQQAKLHNAKWIGNRNYGTNAMLAHHLKPYKAIAQLNERSRYAKSPQIDPFAPGLVVERQQALSQNKLHECFGYVEKLSVEYVADVSAHKHAYDIYLVSAAKNNWIQTEC